jgi:hypothetical protein
MNFIFYKDYNRTNPTNLKMSIKMLIINILVLAIAVHGNDLIELNQADTSQKAMQFGELSETDEGVNCF